MSHVESSDPSTRLASARCRIDLAVVVAVSLLVPLLFCKKAFHIDDTLYLSIARQILVDPLRPFDGMINWQQITEPAWKVSISPPGFSYWLAAWMAFGVRSEIGLHVAGSFWVVMLGVATYFWARRIGPWPLGVALLAVTGPLVVVGQNLMLDVPMLALATSSVALFLHAYDRRSIGRAIAAGLLAGMSVNIKYAGIVAVGVMFIDVLLTRQWRLLAGPAVALGLFFAGQWASANIYGATQLVRAREWISILFPSGAIDVLHRSSLSVLYLGSSGAWLFWLAGAALPPRGGRWWVAAIATLGAIGAVVDFRRAQPEPMTAMMWAALGLTVLYAFNGWALLSWVAVRLLGLLRAVSPSDWLRAWRDRQIATRPRTAVLVTAWTIGFWYLGALNGPFVAPRAMLPCLIGLAMALMALTETAADRRLAGWGTIALSAMIAAAVGYGDYRWANCYRDWSSRLTTQYRPTDGRLFFLGHWGWQHYAEAAGMVPYDLSRTRLEPGDVLVFPLKVDRQAIAPVVLLRLRQIGIVRESMPRWIPRTRDANACISFYGDTARGRIPWGWSRDDLLEEFLILRYDDGRLSAPMAGRDAGSNAEP